MTGRATTCLFSWWERGGGGLEESEEVYSLVLPSVDSQKADQADFLRNEDVSGLRRNERVVAPTSLPQEGRIYRGLREQVGRQEVSNMPGVCQKKGTREKRVEMLRGGRGWIPLIYSWSISWKEPR